MNEHEGPATEPVPGPEPRPVAGAAARLLLRLVAGVIALGDLTEGTDVLLGWFRWLAR